MRKHKGQFKSHDPRSGKGGKRKGVGRPTKQKQEVKKLAAEMAREYIEKNVDPVLKAYKELASGRPVKHYNQQTGEYIYTQQEVDSATLRHWIDKLVSNPKIEFGVELRHNVTVITIDANIERRKRLKEP